MGVRSLNTRGLLAALFLSSAAACGTESAESAESARSAASAASIETAESKSPSAVCADPINSPDHCAYELKDSHLRTAAPAIGQDEALDEASSAVFNIVSGTGPEATEESVARARRALTEAGHDDAIVRLGRPDDPTVPGALLWAVRIGDVCVLGDVIGPERSWHEWYAGLLPDGRCLAV